MEEKKVNRIPPPGIAEAIHPEIGNGIALNTTSTHEVILRSPDPSKPLDDLLLIPDLISRENTSSLQPEKIKARTEEPDTLPRAIETTGDEMPEPTDKEFISTSRKLTYPPETEETGELIGKVKTPKSGKKIKKPKTEIQDHAPGADEPEVTHGEEKVLKAGKLIRKAAKSVKRRLEEEKTPQEHQVEASPETSLSPYTKWLKSLAGSEYVHPYEDDFAFTQGKGPAGEGISETYADLLAGQGYKEQAIEMYTKLMEKYPEKSGFFAAKIEALQ